MTLGEWSSWGRRVLCNRLLFFQAPGPGLNYIVLLTCAVCFVTYSVAALIVHKLDMIDINRVGVIPFCGKNGLYKYEILVKTGWGRGSGEPIVCSCA